MLKKFGDLLKKTTSSRRSHRIAIPKYNFSKKDCSDSHTIEIDDELYLEQLKHEFNLLYPNEKQRNPTLQGFATPQDTLNYSKRRKDIGRSEN